MNPEEKLNELIICALEQGYGTDMSPMSNNYFIDLGTYLRLKEIVISY